MTYRIAVALAVIVLGYIVVGTIDYDAAVVSSLLWSGVSR